MSHPAGLRRPHVLVAGVLLSLSLLAAPARGAERLARLEAQFEAAAARVEPATVVCVPAGVQPPFAGFSSGVLVSPDGIVLTNAAVGMRWHTGPGGEEVKEYQSDVDVRVRSAQDGSTTLYRARVIERDPTSDSAVLRVLHPPPAGLPYARLGSSDELEVGRFALFLGTAFDEQGEAPPSLTSGIVSSLEALAPGSAGGRYEWVYVSAGVNQGVEGGAVLDLDGRLIGTVSGDVQPEPSASRQFLGRVVPIERIRAVHRGVAELARLPVVPRASDVGPGGVLEQTFHDAAEVARRGVVSLAVTRRLPVSDLVPSDAREVRIARYRGPVSGIVAGADGEIVTSLYNLTNVSSLVEPVWKTPPEAEIDAGLADVVSITACFADGVTAPARFVGYDRRLGLALIQADLEHASATSRPYRPRPLEAVAPGDFEPGRFVLAVGDPFGRAVAAEPLVTMGILSRFHPEDAAAAWRGEWQTDAAGLDSNCGGAAVDLDGRLYGLFQIWHPSRHGRDSGIAFIVPWARVLEALPAIRRGDTPGRAFLGVRFAPGPEPRVAEVIAGTAAARAGLRAGDLIHRIDREETPVQSDVVAVIGFRCRGDLVEVTVERQGSLLTLPVRLGEPRDR